MAANVGGFLSVCLSAYLQLPAVAFMSAPAKKLASFRSER